MQIATAFVDMFHAKKRLHPLGSVGIVGGDYNYGWKCYHWQTFTYLAI